MALEAERRTKEDAVAALAEEKQSRENIIAALSEERSGKEAAQEVNTKQISRLVEEKEESQQEGDALRQEVRELTAKLEATERKVSIY